MNVAARRLLLVYGLVVLVAIVYWPSSTALARLWLDYQDLGYTHGPLVAAVALWLIFRDREQLSAVEVKPCPPAFVALAIASFAWLLFYRAGILGLHLALFPLLIWFAALAVFGWPLARLLAFPLGFFYFALTVFDRLNGVLQSLTVHVTGAFLSLAGVSAHIDGNHVVIPAGAFEVANGCSGQHFLVVGLALATLWGELGRESLRRRILLVAIMSGLALVTNWIRVFAVIMAGHLSHMQHWLIHQHYYFGWVLFAGAFAIFLLIARALPTATAVAPPAMSSRRSSASIASLPAYGVAAMLLLAGPAVLLLFAPASQAFNRFAAAVGSHVRASILRPPVSSGAGSVPQPARLAAAQELLLKGVGSLRDGAHARAEAQLLQARSAAAGALLPPQEAMLIAALVESRLGQNKVAEAQAAQGELEQLMPESKVTKLLSARVALARKDALGGIAQLQRLVVEAPDYLQARLVLGSALMARGSVMQAQGQFAEALRIAPGNPDAQSLATQARMLQIDPAKLSNPLTLNNLAWLYHLAGDERAEETARRAHELAPAEPAITDTYGWILLSQGRGAQALPLLETAARAAPQNADIAYHYGVALAQEGRRDEAITLLRRLIATQSTFAAKGDAEKLLAKLQG